MKWRHNPKDKGPRHIEPADRCMMTPVSGKSRNGRSEVVWRLTAMWAERDGVEMRSWITGCATRPAASLRLDPTGRATWWARAWDSDGQLLSERWGDDHDEERLALERALAAFVESAPRSPKARPRTIASFF